MSHRRTQEDRILWLLQTSYPGWVPADAVSRISLQYNSRILALRRKGWQIANRVETRAGVKHGSFRLATPGTRPNPRPEASNVLPTSYQKSTKLPETLFDLPELGHRDDG